MRLNVTNKRPDNPAKTAKFENVIATKTRSALRPAIEAI